MSFGQSGARAFFLITTGDESDLGIHGALTKRQHPLDENGRGGFECTISVDDIEATREAIEKAGGKIVMVPDLFPNLSEVWMEHRLSAPGDRSPPDPHSAGTSARAPDLRKF